MLQVAVIDDGINAGKLLHPDRLVKDFIVDGCQSIVRERKHNDPFLTLHGTTCARIIELYQPSVEFISLCIFDQKDLTTDCSRLVMALTWCKRMQIPLIHMSVGTRKFDDYDQVRNIIAGMIANGQVMVAAGSNAGDYTMPAGMGGILGVAADRFMTGQAFSYKAFCKGIQVEASAIHKLINKDGTFEITTLANSYAAPVLTAAVCPILKDIRKEERCFLKVFQALFPEIRYSAFRPDFIKNAVVLNLSKTRLEKEHFFFSGMEIMIEDMETDIVIRDGRKKCFVFLPGQDETKNMEILSFLEKEQNRFIVILYCGRARREFLERIKDCILWCEQDCGIYKQPEQTEIVEQDCPIVLVKAKDWSGGDLAWKLEKKFGEQGYQCIAVSTHRYSYLYGFEYIPDEIGIEKMMCYLKTMYRPDIVIVWECEMGDMSQERDVYCIRVENNYRGFGKSKYFIADEVEAVYRDIVEYFS